MPEGHHIELPGRGTTFYRDVPGPEGAPTLLLLHGWTATADLNWYNCYAPLAKHYRIIALDQRGHGQGIRSARPFRLADCADDAAALADRLNIDTFIPVGYSMGGTVAQLMWRRHEARVRGIVLAATSSYFVDSREERLSFFGLHGLGAVARITPRSARDWFSNRLYIQRKTLTWEPWAVEQLATHEWRQILEAGGALGSFDARQWLPEVNVPTGVVITTSDRVVPTRRQRAMSEIIPHSRVWTVDGDHDAVFARADVFVPALLEAAHFVHHESVRRALHIDSQAS